jgi:hypothetical protein
MNDIRQWINSIGLASVVQRNHKKAPIGAIALMMSNGMFFEYLKKRMLTSILPDTGVWTVDEQPARRQPAG